MRTTGVKLVAETGQYKREMGAAAKATRGLKDDVTGVGSSMVTASDRLRGAAVKSGRDLDEMGRHAESLSRKIRDVERDIGSLAKGFAATGDVAFLAAINKQKRALSQLKSVEKFLPKPDDMTRVGTQLGARVGTGFAASLRTTLPAAINPATAATVGLVAAGVAPLLGAAVAGAIIGGAGLGGVVGGLVVASRDVRVQAAMERLADGLQVRLDRAAGSFVHPAIAGIGRIEKALGEVDFEQIFADAARYVGPLSEGSAQAIEDLARGLQKLIRNAGPVILAISEGIAGIGKHVGQGLASLADNGEDAADALRTVFGLINYAVDSTFNLINGLTELYAINRKLGGDLGLQLLLKATGAQLDELDGSVRRTGSGFFGVAQGIQLTQKAFERMAPTQALTKYATDALTAAQDQYTRSLDGMAPGATRAIQLVDGLRRASRDLYGAQIGASEANEMFAASWDGLSRSVTNNGRTLNINTAAGRANRDALQALLTANNESFYANIATGMSVEQATKKHRDRTAQVVRESEKLGINKAQTQGLIETYGKIPGRKATDLVIEGLSKIADQLENVYWAQRALAEGTTIEAITRRGWTFKGWAEGGWTGPGHKHQPAGVVHADEFVVHKQARRQVERQAPGFLDELNATGRLPGYHRGGLVARPPLVAQVPGYAGGGFVAPVDTSRRWPFKVNVAGTHVMSLEDALSRVTPAVPSGGRTSDWIVATAQALVPGIRVLSKDRPGARTLSGRQSYHALGRAVDFEPSELLARLWNERYMRQTKEFISPYQQHNINNGQRWRATGAVWRQHNFAGGNPHDHIAMANGGMIREPVLGVGRSGATYSFAERGPERVLSAGQTAAVGGGSVTLVLQNHGVIGSRAEVDDWLTGAVDRLRNKGRIT
jgi:hypothetical protein